MNSLIIILSQIILKDYKEIRWGMIISSILFIIFVVIDIINMLRLNWDIIIPITIMIIIGYMLELYYLPKLWKSKKIIKNENNKS
jgi:hypothetical protein